MDFGVTFTPTQSKSKIFCSVFGCSSKKCRETSLSFHKFPRAGELKVDFENKFGIKEQIDRRVLWEKQLKMGKKVTNYMTVCSLHFTKDDYSLYTGPDQAAKARYLKKTAVPSVNLPKSTVEINQSDKKKQCDEKRKLRMEEREKRLLNENDSTCDCLFNNNENNEESEIFSAEGNIENTPSVANPEIQEPIEEIKENFMKDAQTQVTSGDFITTFFIFLKNDQQLSTATGIPNLKLFDNIVKSFEIAAPQLKNHTRVLTAKDRVLLTLLKLKQNLSYAFLSLLFPTVAPRYCSEIICNSIDILYEVLTPYIHFASKDEILRNIPHCFDDYSDTRIILDCTEIEIQKPKNVCCQISTYSHYKGRHTVKFLTGVTPGGIISFCSKAYGGRVSDKSIFEQSGLIEILEENSAIMVDKGFLIDEVCADNNIKLIRPSFFNKNQSQFSENDAVESSNIASARVHVERLNQRIKVFDILGGKMSSCLVPKSEKIMFICCALANLTSPVFKDNKFNE
ncbi:uncharacterized protein LOC127280845 [Leptopilina boulardi]|uniref:uncharacterized protein LOC127280845 n=1 Tax=Leptopilina boulardi TaxID=63433 RepID=UPI0021F5A0CB|nr:uncharacterized protein LOC127280845 [Leptopilina boulardi]